MKIKKLFLQNFRNYENEVFEFSDGLNVLFGKNGQGKTNCAEAVFYLCTGASLRIRHDKQLIKMGAESAKIIAEAENRYGRVTIEADIYENKREIRVNGSKIHKNADLMGHINSVFFSPGELRLIQDGPDERRRFMNISISQTSPAYYTALLRYNKIPVGRKRLCAVTAVAQPYSALGREPALPSYAPRFGNNGHDRGHGHSADIRSVLGIRSVYRLPSVLHNRIAGYAHGGTDLDHLRA